MTLLQMEYFQEIAKTGSISIAAKTLGVSRSSLSITIDKLEIEIGYPLLEHQGRTILLTPYGEKVLHYSYIVLHTAEDIKQEFIELKGMDKKEKISLGVTDCNYYGDWVLDLLDQYPDLKLNVLQMSREEIYTNLLEGNIDFGIANGIEYHEQLGAQLLFSQPYQLLVFHDHPFALRGSITIKELAKEPLISLPPSHKDRMIDNLCSEITFHPNIIFEGDPDIMSEMFHYNVGSILTCAHNYKQWLKLPDENYTLLNIDGISSRYEMYLLWSKHRFLSRWSRIFKRYVLNYYHV